MTRNKLENGTFLYLIKKKWKFSYKNRTFIKASNFFKIFILIIGVKMKLRIKICGRFSDTASHKIDFTAYGFPRDHPPALESNLTVKVPL